VALLFRARLGRFLLALVVCGTFTLLASSMLSESATLSDRVLSLDNTRAAAWSGLLEQFLDNPFFGTANTQFSESSYLGVLARFGLVGALPFLAAMIIAIRSILQLLRVRKRLDDPMLADFVIAGLVSLAVGGIFEGSLLTMLSPTLFLIYIYLGLMTFLIDYAEVIKAEHLPAASEELEIAEFPILQPSV
jgi:O-antigen ligase